jgi:UDP-N-acetylmuramoyl-L-alanyl-D-glutamate--2,6-diaminopimelate ligase
MGAIAARLADRVWVTSDNPRSEPAARIIEAVIVGARDAHARSLLHVEVDRARAISSAVTEADSSDIVLIAGKGHETWQDIAGVRYPFDDRSVAAEAQRARAATGA